MPLDNWHPSFWVLLKFCGWVGFLLVIISLWELEGFFFLYGTNPILSVYSLPKMYQCLCPLYSPFSFVLSWWVNTTLLYSVIWVINFFLTKILVWFVEGMEIIKIIQYSILITWFFLIWLFQWYWVTLQYIAFFKQH